MKKIFVKLASMVLIFVLCVSSLVGCGLVTTDNERDMNQVVATVQIEKGAPKDEIIKKDMVMAYMNYGYMYEQYYGYTREQTFEFIIDTLVNNRVLVQNAIKDYQEKNNKTSWNMVDYLSEDSKVEAEYLAKKAMSDLIESYKTKADEEKADTAWATVRTAPTNAANKEDELTLDEKKNYAIVNDDVATFNKVIELLRVNELLGKDYKSGDITTTDYYKQTLESYQESELITTYENEKRAEVRAKFDFATLEKAYVDKYGAQADLTDAELAEKFGSASSSEPILVGANGSYGYVYNLLLGADSRLTSEISAIKSDLDNKNITKEKYAELRKEILAATVVTDQRSTWITSGYDFDFATKKFTGDYTFAEPKDNVADTISLDFKGEVVEIKPATEDESAKYKVTSLTEYNLDNFVEMMEKYVYGATKTGETVLNNASVYKKVVSNDVVVEYENKINELLFAFSTDPGSLNTYKGYVIKPVPEGSDSEEYMQEFADGARELIQMKGSSYIMVATDYGYHVMFYSEILDTSYDFDSLEKYLDDLYGDKTADEWKADYNDMLDTWDDFDDTENYMYLLANSLFSTEVDNAISTYQRDTLNKYRYNDNSGVKLYEDRYADLLA